MHTSRNSLPHSIPTQVQERAQRLLDIFFQFHITTDYLTAGNIYLNPAPVLQKRESLKIVLDVRHLKTVTEKKAFGR